MVRKQKWKGGVAGLCLLNGLLGILSSILPHFKFAFVFEAELLQRVDTGSACFDTWRVELFQPVLSCCHRRADTGLNHIVRVSNHMQNEKFFNIQIPPFYGVHLHFP